MKPEYFEQLTRGQKKDLATIEIQLEGLQLGYGIVSELAVADGTMGKPKYFKLAINGERIWDCQELKSIRKHLHGVLLGLKLGQTFKFRFSETKTAAERPLGGGDKTIKPCFCNRQPCVC
jgi:hypothetical protein